MHWHSGAMTHRRERVSQCQRKAGSLQCIPHTDAEAAIKELQHAGFDMTRLSIVGKDYHTKEDDVGNYNAGDRMKYLGKLGAFWGGIWSLLFGSAFFLIPGLGPLVVAGPLVQVIVSVLEGAVVVGGTSALGAGPNSIGIPQDSILQYETALKADEFLLVAHGSNQEVSRAEEILHTTGSTHIGQYPSEEPREAAVPEVKIFRQFLFPRRPS